MVLACICLSLHILFSPFLQVIVCQIIQCTATSNFLAIYFISLKKQLLKLEIIAGQVVKIAMFVILTQRILEILLKLKTQ